MQKYWLILGLIFMQLSFMSCNDSFENEDEEETDMPPPPILENDPGENDDHDDVINNNFVNRKSNENMGSKQFGDLLMDIAFDLNKDEFRIILLGVFARKLISRKDLDKMNSFSQLVTHFLGKQITEDNLTLLVELLTIIRRPDLNRKIESYKITRKPELLVTNSEDTVEFNIPEYEEDDCEEDDEEMIDSQQSCVSMKSLSDDEKLQRLNLDVESCDF